MIIISSPESHHHHIGLCLTLAHPLAFSVDGSTSIIVLGRGSVAEYLEELENRTRQVEQAMVDKGVPLPTADPMASGSLSATGKKKK